MLQQAAELADLILNESAYIYVCGDAKNMAKDVANTMSQIIKQTGNVAPSSYPVVEVWLSLLTLSHCIHSDE